jgi:hypothetical protein
MGGLWCFSAALGLCRLSGKGWAECGSQSKSHEVNKLKADRPGVRGDEEYCATLERAPLPSPICMGGWQHATRRTNREKASLGHAAPGLGGRGEEAGSLSFCSEVAMGSGVDLD